MNKKPVYIDTDMGLGTPGAEIDDGAALIALLRCEKIQPTGIGSVFGNVPLADSVVNLDRLVTLMERKDFPLGKGTEAPLEVNMNWFSEWQQGYDETNPWEAAVPEYTSADLLIRSIKESKSPITVLSIGPMTNIAVALSQAPEITELAREVVVMGGSFSEEPSPPEFNLRCDPEAANAVLNAGWPLVIFGLDVTRKILFTREMFHTLKRSHPAVQLLRSSADRWIDRVESMGWESGGCSLHDAIAGAYIMDPSLFNTVPISSVKINLEDGPEKGSTTIVQSSKGNVKIRIAVDVDVSSCRDLIWSLIDH